MTGADDDRSKDELARRKLVAQVTLILTQFPDADVYPENWREVGVDYIYRTVHLLMRDEDVERVRPLVRGRLDEVSRRAGGDDNVRRRGASLGEITTAPGTRPTGLSLFTVPDDERTIPQLCDDIDGALGPGVATPNHFFFVVGQASHCPAAEPEPVPADADPTPKPCSGDDGAGVRIHILDSGLVAGAELRHSWLAGVTGETEDTYFPAPPDHQIMPYSGHGTFCAGVLRCAAPGADVHVNRTFYGAGGAWEADIAAQVQSGLSHGADILSLSAGTYTRDDIPSLGFDVILDQIARYKGVVLVAAAGNDASRRPFFPAASPGVVSVGALDATGQARASYSNHGGWVDVYAPGTDLVNAYVDGKFTYTEPPYDVTPRTETFTGMAKWSGTSFATPYVAGLIAVQMYRTGQNGKDAAAAVLATAQASAIPGVGAILT